jgi:hypothetical protein
MAAASYFVTSKTICQAISFHIPDESKLSIRRRHKLKSDMRRKQQAQYPSPMGLTTS